MYGFTLDDVKKLVEENRFHHATARTVGSPMIWIYAVKADGFRGYELAAVLCDTPEHHAYFRSIGHGVSVGAFGSG